MTGSGSIDRYVQIVRSITYADFLQAVNKSSLLITDNRCLEAGPG